jgi:hypothetical protein
VSRVNKPIDRGWLLGMSTEERRAERFTERGNGIAPWIVRAVREQPESLSDATVAQRIGVDARLVTRVRALDRGEAA